MESLTVWAPATPVKILRLSIDGVINAVQINTLGPSYLVGYYHNGIKYEIWLYTHEFEVLDMVKKLQVGFTAVKP